jgi:hypothetical protein
MKLTQAEIDLLPAYQSQLSDIRTSLRAFDIYANNESIASDTRREFTRMHNDLSFMITTMQKYIDGGAS